MNLIEREDDGRYSIDLGTYKVTFETLNFLMLFCAERKIEPKGAIAFGYRLGELVREFSEEQLDRVAIVRALDDSRGSEHRAGADDLAILLDVWSSPTRREA